MFSCTVLYLGNIDNGTKEIIISAGKKNKDDQCTVGHNGHVLALAISSDGLYLVWEEREGERERGIEGGEKWVTLHYSLSIGKWRNWQCNTCMESTDMCTLTYL